MEPGRQKAIRGESKWKWTEWIDFEEENLRAAPDDLGVYEYRLAGALVYVGEGNLRTRFLSVLRTTKGRVSADTSVRGRPSQFRYWVAPEPTAGSTKDLIEAVQDSLLLEFGMVNGRWPEDNERLAEERPADWRCSDVRWRDLL